MKYYRLEITDNNGAPPVDDSGNAIGPFDTTDTPGRGLHIDFDALITGFDVVSSGTMIAIYGLPISMLRQSVQLKGYQLNLYAGFSAGLPLANPGQAGLIISGQIYNPYANWIGTHQSMNLIVNPSPLLTDKGQASSITLDGKAGEKLSDVLRRALAASFPGFTLETTISDELILAEDEKGVYPRLAQLAGTMRDLTLAMVNSESYLGVQMVMQNRIIRVFDNTSVNGIGIQILPQELLGQPTWIGPFTASFKCPMRADLRCGDLVELPADIISGPSSLLSVNSSSSNASVRNTVNFTGMFLITSVRHVGQYLSPDNSNSWVTIYEAIAQAI